ncbi:MAG: NADPH-dependent glutamate synthase [Firmicutes bacterium]|nr:NADPH-dependent glutamate synthase [Bacillota bacterium]MBR1993041.1 NADPH-dependent glutamate synthase [Bacillota bacterium]
MINLKKVKNPMPEQDPIVRAGNFEEVAEGYTAQMAINEAMRCLKCRKKPCTKGCPVMVRIPEFVAKVAEGDFEAAYQIISDTSALPRICGRVCPQENQCEGFCVQGLHGEPVAIGRLERFVSDWHAAREEEMEKAALEAADDEFAEFAEEEVIESNGRKVAVVGAGPAGLTCAGDLAAKGYEVTVFEALHKPGGVLAYGIPEFRLPKDIVAAEVRKLEKRGVTFVNNAVIGRAETVDELFEDGFEAVFVGTGAGLPSFMNIPGENLLGVCSANEYLTRINLMKGYLPEYDTPVQKAKNIAVVGGGNVAMDAARCAKRMGAENVYIVYRRSMDEIPARAEEIHHAIEEGIDFQLLKNPVAVLGDENGYVTGLECVEMELGEPDASGRRRPVVKEGSNFVLDVDCVIMAIGTKLNKLILETTENLEANDRGGIGTDAGAATNREGVFAGGDAVTGAATVILAMGAGKTAAASIDEYLGE